MADYPVKTKSGVVIIAFSKDPAHVDQPYDRVPDYPVLDGEDNPVVENDRDPALGQPAAPIINGLPTYEGFEVESHTLTAIPAPLSQGNPTPTRTWQWLRNGVEIVGATSSFFTLTATEIGTRISVRQTETNASGSPSATSLQGGIVTALDEAPAITGVPTISGSTVQGNVLTATAATPVTGVPTPTRTWQWLRDGVPISGATAITYTTVSADLGAAISVRQIETNSVNVATATSAETGAITSGNVAPVINGVPTIPGTAAEGDTLDATAAPLSAGSPTPTRTWQWLRDTVAIPGATSASYTVVGADVGTQLSVRQTETNVVDFDDATSAQTAVVTGQQITMTDVVFNGTKVTATVNRTGTFHWMVSDNPTELDTAVIAGGGLDSGSFALNSAGVNSGTLDYSAVAPGLHYLHCVADAVGSPNPSTVRSRQYTFQGADVTPPAIIGGTPGDDATDVAIDADIQVQFSENVQFAVSGTIILYDVTGAGNFEVFDVATDIGAGVGQVSISGDTLTIRPTSDFANSNDYAVRFSGNPVEDLAGNDLVDISDSTTYNFTTVAAAGGSTPTYGAAGVGSGSGSSLVLSWPAGHASGDWAALPVKNRGNDSQPATPSGWSVGVVLSTGSGSSDVRLTIFVRQATSGAEADVTIADTGNHQIGQIQTVSGATTAAQLGSGSTGNGTAVSLASGTTGGANRLLMGFVANATDTTVDQIAAWTNGNLTSLTDRGGIQSAAVAGGGIDVFTGEKAAAGAAGDTTATLATSSKWAAAVLEFAA